MMQSDQGTKGMSICDIDAVNYAGAIGASAAGRVYALLANPDKEFDYRWMSGDPQMALDEVERVTDAIAEFICRTSCTNPETVYRHIEAETGDLLCLQNDWFAEPLAHTTAFSLFTSTCIAAFNAIKGEQRANAFAAELEARDVPPLALKDSIFEPHGSLGEMRPEAVQALKDGARHDAEAAASAEADNEIDEVMSAGAGDDAGTGSDQAGQEFAEAAALDPEPIPTGADGPMDAHGGISGDGDLDAGQSGNSAPGEMSASGMMEDGEDLAETAKSRRKTKT